MPNHDIDPFPRRIRAFPGRLRASAVAVGAIALVGVLPATAMASGGSSAPPAEQQQTTASSHPSGGAAAHPASHKRKKSRKANHHVKLPKELKKIAMCESGGNPRALSPSGKYRG